MMVMVPLEAFTFACLFISLYFEVFMLVSFIDRSFRRSKQTAATDVETYPSFAIVVPAYNEEHTIAATIESLMRLDYPADKLSIIVVDDGSKDKTLEVAERFATKRGDAANLTTTVRALPESMNAQSPKSTISKENTSYTGEFRGEVGSITPRVLVFHKENGGKHSAMNYALAHTDAEFIGCLDADSTVAPDALRRIAPIFADLRVAAVTPGIFIKKPENLLQRMQEVEYRLSVFVRFTQATIGSAFITPGPFSMFRARVVRETGGWRHGHSTEDLEMALRIQSMGYLIGNAPGAIVYTGTPKTLPKLFKQRVRWTYGFLRNSVEYRHMYGNPKYGNLGLIMLPTALVSIFIALYFFVRIVWNLVLSLHSEYIRYSILGISFSPGFDPFYINTSVMWLLVVFAVIMVLALIGIGTYIGTGKRRLPSGTPLFVLFYGFLAPLWLGTALFRAIFKTGVKWR